jgi:DNA-binding NarL/FixJ family response regulator
VSRAVEAGLTPRELTVLTMLAAGHKASAIARTLSITTHTVSKHQQNIYRKLGTNDRLSTVLTAQHAGILNAAGRTTA